MKFIKDKTGIITQFVISDHFVFQKTDDYKPVVRKATTLTPAQLQTCEGKYREAKGLVIQITATPDRLLIKQLWNARQFRFVPESELNFFGEHNP